MIKRTKRFLPWLEQVIPWLILVLIAVFTYAKFIRVPYIGFEFTSGKVSEIFIPTSYDSLQIGDQLIKVGQVPMEEFMIDLRQTLFDNFQVGQSIPLRIERGGEKFDIDWVHPGPDPVQLAQRFNGIWWMPYVFWIAGTASLLFIRPKNSRWRLLIAFNYLTAIWLAAGSGASRWHIWQSAIVLRSAVWLCLPVYLHLHWMFPEPLLRLPKVVGWLLYLIGGVLALA